MPTSSVPAVKAKVLQLLTAQTVTGEGLEGVQVTWGDPGTDGMTREDVFMGDPFIDETLAAISNQYPRNESYTLPIIVHVRREGDDAQGTEERMWQLVAEVEAVIGGATNLAGAGGTYAAQIEQKLPDTFPSDGARVALCLVPLRIQARL